MLFNPIIQHYSTLVSDRIIISNSGLPEMYLKTLLLTSTLLPGIIVSQKKQVGFGDPFEIRPYC